MLTERLASWFRRPSRAARPVALRLERLEDRVTPTVAANDLFVSSLYQGLLGRPADHAGLTYWTNELDSGVSRTQVAEGIAGSNEALNRDVQLFYDVLLGRPADAAGLTYWTDELASGETLNQVKAGILGSNEFFNDVGGTNNAFLNSLYADELGRPVDAVGLTYWDNQLDSGVSRTMVAGEVLASPAAGETKVASFYKEVLDRTPDTAGLNFWSAQLEAGVPETNVLAGFLGSNEYYAKVQTAAATTLDTDPNQAAADMIANDGLFAGPLPNAEYLGHSMVTLPPVAPVVVTPANDNYVDPSQPVDNTDAPINPDANNNTTVTTDDGTDDSDAGVYNAYVDTDTTTDDTYADPGTTDDDYTDPNAGDTSGAVDTGSDVSYDDGSADDGSFDTSDSGDFGC